MIEVKVKEQDLNKIIVLLKEESLQLISVLKLSVTCPPTSPLVKVEGLDFIGVDDFLSVYTSATKQLLKECK